MTPILALSTVEKVREERSRERRSDSESETDRYGQPNGRTGKKKAIA